MINWEHVVLGTRYILFLKSSIIGNLDMILKWIGCGFGRFSEVHVFEKPNDEHALNLMNSCAVAVMEKLSDFVFSYGVSDEYRYFLYFGLSF